MANANWMLNVTDQVMLKEQHQSTDKKLGLPQKQKVP